MAVGVYDKVPGDGREFAVTDPGAVTVRAEDGRPVSGVDISAFISALPTTAVAASPVTTENGAVCKEKEMPAMESAQESTATGERPARKADGSEKENECKPNSTTWFSTEGASGSTSQAANVVEALEAGATALLLDEDTCAGNVSGTKSSTIDSGGRALYVIVFACVENALLWLCYKIGALLNRGAI